MEDYKILQSRYNNLLLLLSGLNHEIRNPFATINATLSLLASSKSMTEIEKKRIINNSILSMDAISKILKSIVIINSANKNKINLGNLLEGIIEVTMLFNCVKQNIEHLFFDKSSLRDIEVSVNQNDLYHIISNLIMNSAEACCNKENSAISIYKKNIQNSNEVILIIKDNGIGIEKEKINKLFEVGITTKESSNGYGLAIVKMLCEKNNINIDIKSEVNIGTTVLLGISKNDK